MKNNYNVVLWDVDTQVDFMENSAHNQKGYDGKLAIADAMSIADNLRVLTNYGRENSLPIFGSVDWHSSQSGEFPREWENADFVNTFPPHCIAGSYGAEKISATNPVNPFFVNYGGELDSKSLVEKIKKHSGDVFFRKDAFDVFSSQGNPYAKSVVEQLGIKKAIVYGVALEVCNNYAVNGLRDLGVEVYAVEDAMKAINENSRAQILDAWRSNGVKVVKLEDVLNSVWLR